MILDLYVVVLFSCGRGPAPRLRGLARPRRARRSSRRRSPPALPLASASACARCEGDAHRESAAGSSMRAQASGAEADAQVVALGAEVDHLREIQAHRPLLAVELVPPVLAEGFAERAQCLVGDAQAEHLTALKADRDASCGGRHQRAGSACATGCTISVNTPSVPRGCTKATREPRMPVRGCSSMSAKPASRSSRSVASTSVTW